MSGFIASSGRTLRRRGWELVRKEGLEPSRCYPQVPETCASTSSATFAGVSMLAAGCRPVKGTCGPQVPAYVFGGDPRAPRCASTSSATFAGVEILASESAGVKEPVGHRFRLKCSGETPAPPAARLPVPPLSQGFLTICSSENRLLRIAPPPPE